MAYTNVNIETKPGYLAPFGGTSAAAPWLCGMLACLFTGYRVPAVEILQENGSRIVDFRFKTIPLPKANQSWKGCLQLIRNLLRKR